MSTVIDHTDARLNAIQYNLSLFFFSSTDRLFKYFFVSLIGSFMKCSEQALGHVENKFSFMFGEGQAIWSTDNYFVFVGFGIMFAARRLKSWPASLEGEWELV